MLRRRQINAEPLLWRIADRLRSLADFLRWPFERLAWALEHRLVWPLQERLVWPLRDRAADWSPPSRAVGAGALAALAIAVVAVGAVMTVGGDGGEQPARKADPVLAIAPAPEPEEPEPSGPVLRGAPPQFGVGEGVGVAAAAGARGGADSTDTSAGDAAAVTAGDAPTAPGDEAAATTSSRKPMPAGPAAMKVARRFSEAFVSYEVGERQARALDVFEETATPQLAEALAERPPRQPRSTEVPKARVLNLVPGPRRGGVYTVSASLLRVGAISELRLKLAARDGAWQVTDVRG